MRDVYTLFSILLGHQVTIMPAIVLNSEFDTEPSKAAVNPLPKLLQTPAGLALIEIQGTIHAPLQDSTSSSTLDNTTSVSMQVGRLEFPLYDGQDAKEGPWMKKAYLYIGKHQRLSGEVKKLPKAFLVLTKRQGNLAVSKNHSAVSSEQGQEHLDIMAVVKYKILFASRPEPVAS